jgi:hypothetical protein
MGWWELLSGRLWLWGGEDQALSCRQDASYPDDGGRKRRKRAL